MDSESFDFVIVGGGLAGLVLAARLSEHRANEILVVEAGDAQTQQHHDRIVVPGMWQTLLGSDADWDLRTVPQEGLGRRQLRSHAGRILGGSAAINGTAFSFPSQAVVNAWADLGNEGWDWPAFAESMRRCFTFGRTGDGPIQLSLPTDGGEWQRIWSETLAAHGFAMANASDLFSGRFCGGLVVPDTAHPDTKQRSFPVNTYLSEALGACRQNLTVWTACRANRVLFDGCDARGERVARGVEIFRNNGDVVSVAARKEVLITAGALHSPGVLERSGVGDAQRLSSLGIAPVVDNPYVGENLQNHPVCVLGYQMVEQEEGFNTTDQLARQDASALAAALEAYSKHQQGPLARGGVNVTAQLPLPSGAYDGQLLAALEAEPGPGQDKRATTAFDAAHASFVRSVLASRHRASCSYSLLPGLVSWESNGSFVGPPPGSERYLSILLCLAHPLSRGSVHIASDASEDLDPRYLTHPVDAEVLARHVQFARKLASTQPLASLIKPGGEQRLPGSPDADGLADLNEIRRYLGDTVIGLAHYTGTCAMMPRDMGGVVDPQLRVYGCANVRVCDASVIPITPGTNPQATVYGVAERAADIVKPAHSDHE